MACAPVQSRTETHSFAGHIDDLPDLESIGSATLWIAPDDLLITEIPNLKPMSCPGSNLRAIVTRAIRLSSRHVVLRPLCLEGLVLYKTKISVLVDANGPTYCALIVSSADRIRIRDTIFDHGDCVNATATNAGIDSVLTADSATGGSIVYRNTRSRKRVAFRCTLGQWSSRADRHRSYFDDYFTGSIHGLGSAHCDIDRNSSERPLKRHGCHGSDAIASG